MPKTRHLALLLIPALLATAVHAAPDKRNTRQRDLVRQAAAAQILRLDQTQRQLAALAPDDNPPPPPPPVIQTGPDGLLNTSSVTLYAKPEFAAEACPVLPGQKYIGAIDGFSTPDGRIYKVVDWYNTHIEVSDDAIKLPGAPNINRILGGGILKKQPDAGWQKLFQKTAPDES